MTRPTRRPWSQRGPVAKPATVEPEPSGLAEAFEAVPASDFEPVGDGLRRWLVSDEARGVLDGCPNDIAQLVPSARAALDRQPGNVPLVVSVLADALDGERPGLVVLGDVTLLECSDGESAPAAYRWPDGFTGWAHIKRGAVEDCTVLAALAVGVALWSRLPTADEVAAWLDADEPAGEGVG